MSAPILSILTPAVPSRFWRVNILSRELEKQIGDRPVEHLVLFDNKRRTVGQKRDALIRAAIGKYVAFVDDDDWVEPDYVRELLDAAVRDPDVITFRQLSTVNGQDATVEFRLGYPNETWEPGKVIKRNAWHICAWRRLLAITSSFPSINYGEDWAWAAPLCGLSGLREVHIPRALHHYIHNSQTTEAPPPLTSR